MELRHRARWVLALGIALLATGLAKAWATANAAGDVMILGCGGQSFAVALGQPNWALAHCWGCYAALLGAALIATGFFRLRHLSRRV